MPNKLVRRLLMVSIAVFTTLSMAILTLPFDTQTQAQRTFQPSPGNAPKESTCIPKSDRPPDVQFPEVYDNKKLPALIILPQTGGTPSGSYFRSFGNQDKGLTSFGEKHKKRTENPFAVVLFDIEGAESDWKPGTNFEPAIKRCEKFLEKNLPGLITKHNLDPSRIALAGFSLGGDLSWALNLRRPDLFHGAIVINSQSTDPPTEVGMRQLVAKNARFVLMSSEIDAYNRLQCMRNAAKKLVKSGVKHWFGVIPGSDFVDNEIREKMLMPSVDYVLFNKDFDRRDWDNLTNPSSPKKQEDPICTPE